MGTLSNSEDQDEKPHHVACASCGISSESALFAKTKLICKKYNIVGETKTCDPSVYKWTILILLHVVLSKIHWSKKS